MARPKLRRFSRPIINVLVLGTAAVGIGALILPPAGAAAGQLLNVVVGNSDSNPIPVRGTVNVGNFPPTTTAAAAPEPFEARKDTTLLDGWVSGSAFITIPAGRRLTAEFLSVTVILPPDQVPHLSFNADSGSVGGFVPLTREGVTDGLNGPVATYSAAVPILDFQTGTFQVTLSRDLPGSFQFPGEAYLAVYLSGHLTPG